MKKYCLAISTIGVALGLVGLYLIDGENNFPIGHEMQLSQKTLQSEEYKAFIQFVQKYGKTYASKDSHVSRFETFKDNFHYVNQHNSNPSSSFKMELNKYSDMTEEEFLAIHGTL